MISEVIWAITTFSNSNGSKFTASTCSYWWTGSDRLVLNCQRSVSASVQTVTYAKNGNNLSRQ